MKKIAILGAGGFAGGSLTEYFSGFKDRYEVIPAARKDADLLSAPSVRSFICQNDPDVVINCAAVGGSRKNGYADGGDVADMNFKLFENVDKALSDRPETVHIFFGSGAQYDKSRPLVKVSESSLGDSVPKDAYGLGKFRAAKYISEGSRERTYMPVIFGLFGPREDYTYKFISNACVKVLLGMDIAINRNVTFDYLYIDDFCRIIDLMAERAAGPENDPLPHRIFNVTPSESVTLLRLAEIVRDISGKSPEIKVLNPGMNPEYTGSNRLLFENLGCSCGFLSYEESVAKLYRALEKNLPLLDTESVRADRALKYCANTSSDNN